MTPHRRPPVGIELVDDPKLKWALVNPYGIDRGGGSFHAGRTLDVLVTKGGGVVAASETGGVWLLPPSSGGIALSRDWENSEVNCLAQGPNGEGHVYAGLASVGAGTTLLETDTSTPLPLLGPWKPIPVPSAVGSVYQIAVIASSGFIALACAGGVYWAAIPPLSWVGAWKYDWIRAEGLPKGTFFSVAEAAHGNLVAGAWGHETLTDRNGLFIGGWTAPTPGSPARLVMRRVDTTTHASTSKIDQTSLYRISVDSCAADRSRVYAMCVGADYVLNAVLRSDDGGETWIATESTCMPWEPGRAKEPLTTWALMGSWEAGGHIHRLRVSPVDPDTLSVSGIFAYISRDGAATWRVLGDRPWEGVINSLHADVHEVEFDPNDASGRSLVVASDGGVAISGDLGATWSDLNETYASLQFYGTVARECYGCGASSPEVYGGGTQDNGNVYSLLTGATEAWKRLDDGDGGQWHAFRLGGFIRSNHAGILTRATWNPGTRVLEWGFEIPLRVAGKDMIGTTVGLIAANVNLPTHKNAGGQTMYAVGALAAEPIYSIGALGGRIHGLFANDTGADMHWEQLANWIPPRDQLVSAVGSATGKKVYVATCGPAGVELLMLTPETGSLSPLGLLPPELRLSGDSFRPDVASAPAAAVDPLARIHRFAVLNDDLAFGLYVDGSSRGFLIRTGDGGSTWQVMPTPSTALTSVEMDWTTGDFYVCDFEHVYVSHNQCKTWRRAALALPQHCQGVDLRFAAQPDGKNFLYLATFGWSLWRAQTNA